ncbi:hypothetical protein GIB67_018672 [Kingdonia uniflora]|uniref:Uncharacterized protein n=1 Tax=Kingdonia uniflora TaxID=39325 RepID=A0A7J7M2T7_9MAGN|nr:hypothetical protein GIB67_018672 [Kingdonia uniflora]
MSASSSINRNSLSLLPPPPLFWSGAGNNSSLLGSSDDENRGRPNNSFKRGVDSNMGKGQELRWRTPGDELHGWDGDNDMFADESHMHGRQDLDHNKHMMNGSGWGR